MRADVNLRANPHRTIPKSLIARTPSEWRYASPKIRAELCNFSRALQSHLTLGGSASKAFGPPLLCGASPIRLNGGHSKEKDSINKGNPTECLARNLHRATVKA